MKRILILRDDHLGDLILTTGLIRNLSLAGYAIDIVCKTTWVDLFIRNPHAAAFGFGENGVPSSQDIFGLAKWIRIRDYDHLFLPYRNTRLLLASALSGVRNRWAQMAGIMGRATLHHCLRSGIRERPRHMADVWLDFARELQVPVDDGHPEIFLSNEELSEMRSLSFRNLGSHSYIVVHAFHGNSSCNWPLEKYAELARRLKLPTVFTGISAERDRIDNVASPRDLAAYWNSCGELSLRQFFALIANAGAIVCSSTGALHVASALGTPSISMFCPHPFVGPDLWRGYGENDTVITPQFSECPRFKDTQIRDCQFCGTLSPERIAKAVFETLAP